MKQVLICAAIALAAALLPGGAADAASPAPRGDSRSGCVQSAPVHHYEDYNRGGHHYDRHHDGWHC